MNNKKYISIIFFVVVVAIAGGVAYYFDPAEINALIGIARVPIAAISDVDRSSIDGVSSLSPPFDQGTGIDTATSSLSLRKKPAEKKDDLMESGTSAPQTDMTQGQGEGLQATTTVPLSSESENEKALNESSSDSGDFSASATPAPCSFPDAAPTATRKIIFNEIAWMGSLSSSDAEWMELKNISTDTVDLSGWELMDGAKKIKISFSAGDAIAQGDFLTLVRGTGDASAPGDGITSTAKIYSGDLANTGDVLALVDPQCGISDYLDASSGWPGGNNSTKATLERDADGIGWHTSALPGGTPGAENSAGPPPTQYKLIVAFEGNAAGATITSDPAGLICAASCTGSFASGTQIALMPIAGASTTFNGWSGLCYGETVCSFRIAANTSITAQFDSALPPAAFASSTIGDVDSPVTSSTSTDGGGGGDTNAGNISESGSSPAHILISAVQIAGASSTNDLVELYNPTGVPVDMTGWKLHKKSQTGADYSLKEFPAGSAIAPGQSFVWANATGGFSETVGADVSSTETLAADNSVALMDATGNIVDAVAWGAGVNQYGEGPPYPTSPGANQLLSRRSSGGAMVDTDNNTNDFILQ
jgi:hypothetical protein